MIFFFFDISSYNRNYAKNKNNPIIFLTSVLRQFVRHFFQKNSLPNNIVTIVLESSRGI